MITFKKYLIQYYRKPKSYDSGGWITPDFSGTNPYSNLRSAKGIMNELCKRSFHSFDKLRIVKITTTEEAVITKNVQK